MMKMKTSNGRCPVTTGREIGREAAENLATGARTGGLSRGAADAALKQLAQQVAQGDPHAVEHLVIIVYELPAVRGAIGRVLFDPDDAADALQETLLGLVGALGSYDWNRSFLSWACGIANYKAIDVLRRRRPAIDLSGPEVVLESERFSSRSAKRLDINRVLKELPPHLEEVVRLRDVDQLSYQEIADSTGTKLNTVRSRLARGRAQAQTLIGAA